jgi:hypothetical protein
MTLLEYMEMQLLSKRWKNSRSAVGHGQRGKPIKLPRGRVYVKGSIKYKRSHRHTERHKKNV